jgi:hypothetical protein
MEDFAEQIRDLQAKTQNTRLQFLLAELASCFIAVDFGNTELSAGNREIAEREVAHAEKGHAVVRDLLPDLDQQELRDGFEPRLRELRQEIDLLKSKLSSSSQGA